MKVEVYRKRLINKIRYFFKRLFNKQYRIELGKEEMIKRWSANPMTFAQNSSGSTLPPFVGLRLNVAAKIMEIGGSAYDKRRF